MEQIIVPVSDVARTEQFFHLGLGFTSVDHGAFSGNGFAHLFGIRAARAKFVTMRLGSDEVVFVQYTRPGKPYPAGSQSPDLWFQHFAVIVSDMDKAYAALRQVPFAPISEGGPILLPPQNGSVRAFKFRDPDGHPLELLSFPKGQGRAVWHQSDDKRVFLGIDHSAIGISDTDRSTAFYRDLLGMTVAYQTVNRGSAQERLDGTFNAVVGITGLRPTSPNGPGIEFLDYFTPPTGRPAARDARSNDLVQLELRLAVDDLSATVVRLHTAHVAFVSPDIVELDDGRRAAMVRDPDGHVVWLDQEAAQPS
ncbi:MAG TPA: VOC family protein [Aliidongia sp.]|uniref:VOC family protein n=1 Tax=Aliidongia sp. TaxID=1914230 RepID=UPI002DDD3908|nr:VOC family protein [Aliidongia sp.]HEV2678603.1 VOC family protein [Aliidongia sp.]